MITAELYEMIDDNCGEGYESRHEVEREIRDCYSGIPGIIPYHDDKRWYIVQCKVRH